MTKPGTAGELASEIVRLALRAGASAAEATVREAKEFDATVRLGQVDKLLKSDSRRLGIRLFHGTRTAISSTSDFSTTSLQQLVADTLEMASAAGEDSAAGLPSEALYAKNPPAPELCFPAASQLAAEAKIELARRCEETSLKYDPRINNSEGAGFSDSLTSTAYANSLGVCRAYGKSVATLHTTPLAEHDGQKQRDYWLATHLDLAQLPPPEQVGAEAARRTLRRLGARKISTCEVPVIFDPRSAATILKNLSEAVAGTSLQRKASFLVHKLGTKIASTAVTIRDDALLPGGVGSRPFDAEGVPSQTTTVVREGVLENYLLDAYSARKLGMVSTGNSDRDLHAAPSVGPSNFYLLPGPTPPEDIIASLSKGLYVTELIGFGVNIVSGDYSRGATGIWIENGALSYPVEEITVAGNLKEMLTSIEAVGNDLVSLGAIFAPTILIGRLVVSGS